MRDKRWRWVLLPNGSTVAQRTETDIARTEVEADFYGGSPMLSTGANMRSISSVLAELVGAMDVQEAQVAPELLTEAWQQAVGDFLASQAQLVGLAAGEALIHTSHPAVRFALQRHKKDIIRSLNSILGEGCVQSVRVMHG